RTPARVLYPFRRYHLRRRIREEPRLVLREQRRARHRPDERASRSRSAPRGLFLHRRYLRRSKADPHLRKRATVARESLRLVEIIHGTPAAFLRRSLRLEVRFA